MKQDAAKVAAAAAAAQQQQQQAWGNAAAAGPKKGLAEIQVPRGEGREGGAGGGYSFFRILLEAEYRSPSFYGGP